MCLQTKKWPSNGMHAWGALPCAMAYEIKEAKTTQQQLQQEAASFH